MTQTDSHVPIVHSLSEIYSPDRVPVEKQRYDQLIRSFKSQFHPSSIEQQESSAEPQFIVRAPGRVNLIGEHIDYSGYGVLPMALEVDAVVACAIHIRNHCNTELELSSKTSVTLNVHIGNSRDSEFAKRVHTFQVKESHGGDIGQCITIDRENHHWSNYVLCGVRGALTRVTRDCLSKMIADDSSVIDLYLMINGNVPMGSGLSSSSALVCACTLATCRAFGKHTEISKQDFGQLAADSERFGMNVQIGGMDQAISFLGEKDHAQYITFEPKLNHQAVSLPSGVSFVVSNTLVGAHKNESAAHNYNRRVVECRLATSILCKALVNTVLSEYHTLHWLQEDMLHLPLSVMIDHCKSHLTKDEYSMEDVRDLLQLDSVQDVRQRYFGSIVLANEEGFKLRQRAIHVFSEAERVLNAVELCSTHTSDTANIVEKFGQLMNDSHSSCRDLFECSCSELDQITSFAQSRAGCLGSRLTGAGWGGCCVSLVRNECVNQFMDDLWQYYYQDKEMTKNVKRSEVLFSSGPSSGAVILDSYKDKDL